MSHTEIRVSFVYIFLILRLHKIWSKFIKLKQQFSAGLSKTHILKFYMT